MAASRVIMLTSNVKHFRCISRCSLNNLLLNCHKTCLTASRLASTSAGSARSPRTSATPFDVEEWKKLEWRNYQTGRIRMDLPEDEKFSVLVIPGHTPLPQNLQKRTRAIRQPKKRIPPRYKSMPIDQDWTDVWPAASTFKWSVVPFPVRQGYVYKQENDGIPRGKYGNVELMKIPNFLHLTPGHVKKQCAAIKKFCNPWPEGLDTADDCEKHFPVEIITRDYVVDSPSLRDPRSRLVTLKVKLSSLELDEHAKDKLRKLVGDRYDKTTDILTIEADRCPLTKQNTDYLIYILTALYKESWKTEAWESSQHEDDMLKYEWDLTAAKTALFNTIKRIKDVQKTNPDASIKLPRPLQDLPDEPEHEDLNKLEVTKQYREALNKIHMDGEDLHGQELYKKATKKLLLGIS